MLKCWTACVKTPFTLFGSFLIHWASEKCGCGSRKQMFQPSVQILPRIWEFLPLAEAVSRSAVSHLSHDHHYHHCHRITLMIPWPLATLPGNNKLLWSQVTHLLPRDTEYTKTFVNLMKVKYVLRSFYDENIVRDLNLSSQIPSGACFYRQALDNLYFCVKGRFDI